MPDDVVTDRSRVIAREPVTATPVADRTSVVSPKPKKDQDRKAKPKVDTLFLFDTSLKSQAVGLRDAYYAGTQMIPIKEWAGLQQALSRFSEVGTLVTFTHSIPGNLLIADHSPSTDEQRNRLAATGVTVIRRLVFEGCNIMGDPAGVAAIVSGIAGPTASATGYTVFTVIREVTVTLTGDEDEAAIRTKLENEFPQSMDFLLPAPTLKQLAGRKGEVKLFFRWFRQLNVDTPPEKEADPKAIKKRSDLGEMLIRTKEEAEEIRAEMNTPVTPTLIVTIENVQAIAK